MKRGRCKACQRYLYRDEHRVCRRCRWRIKGYGVFLSWEALRGMSIGPRNAVEVAPAPSVHPASGGLG